MFYKIRKIKIPYLIRFFIFVFLLFIAIVHIILPIYPWSFPVGVTLLVVWLLFVINPKKIPYLIKIRKWLFYLMKNLFSRKILLQKIKDFKKHFNKIITNNKENFRRNKIK